MKIDIFFNYSCDEQAWSIWPMTVKGRAVITEVMGSDAPLRNMPHEMVTAVRTFAEADGLATQQENWEEGRLKHRVTSLAYDMVLAERQELIAEQFEPAIKVAIEKQDRRNLHRLYKTFPDSLGQLQLLQRLRDAFPELRQGTSIHDWETA